MKSILLLHGAIGAEDQLLPLKNMLAKSFEVFTFNFSGHGGKPFAEDFSIPQFALEVKQWLEENRIKKITVFGYSMGGFVAMYLANEYPQLIDSVVTLATKFHWDEATAGRESEMLKPAKIIEKVPKFAQQLEKRHAPNDWKLLMEKTAEMLQDMGLNNPLKFSDYQHISCPVLVMLGDQDKTVTLVETVTVFNQLQKGQLAVLPSTPHPIEKADTKLVAYLIERFIAA